MLNLPFWYSAVILPPIFSVNSFAMDTPSPVPPRAVFTVKKQSNRHAVCTASKSLAWFSNRTTPSGDNRTVKSPSEYFAAFERMLSRILRSALLSSVRTTGCFGISMSGTIPCAESIPYDPARPCSRRSFRQAGSHFSSSAAPTITEYRNNSR